MNETKNQMENRMKRPYIQLMQIAESMEEYGGSFVQTLGRAMRLADEDNLNRIEAGWPEYMVKYYFIRKDAEGKS